MSTYFRFTPEFYCWCGAVMRHRRTLRDEPKEDVTVCRGCRHRARQRTKRLLADVRVMRRIAFPETLASRG